MARRQSSLAYRAVALLALIGALVSGALLAVKSHGAARARRVTAAAALGRGRPALGARTIASAPAALDAGGAAVPVATVIPPGDAAPAAPSWPPALLNPAAQLRTAWDLALGRPNSREVLFTFDDGPNPGTTDRLLNILDRAGIKAAFFVCGWRLEQEEPLRTRSRDLLRETFRRGHVIGNHTVRHRNMAALTPEQVQYEIDHNAQLIEEVIGQRPHLFRPPYGSYSEDVRHHVESRGDELTLWSIDSHDWQMVGDAQGVAMNVIRLIGNMAGGTILLHDTHPWSVSAAQMVIRWLESENRERADAGRPLYRVVSPADFIEGARERLPLIAAAREEEARQARHTRRTADEGDAAAGTAATGDGGEGAAASAASDAGVASANARSAPSASAAGDGG